MYYVRTCIHCSYNCFVAFESSDDYLDIQFRLLREDFISTLRNGIKEYKKNQTKKGQKFKSGDIKVYEGFHIIKPNFGKDGMTYTVRYVRMFLPYNWFNITLTYSKLINHAVNCIWF